MDKKKVCIVTNFSTTTNFGALLQAYALNRTITGLGCCTYDLYVVGDRKSKTKKLWNQIIKLRFKDIQNEIIDRIQRYKIRDQMRIRKCVMDKFRFEIPHTPECTKDDLGKLQDEYDVFICGSDQIFRPNRLTGQLEDYYWLKMVNNGAVKASYAASIGISSYDSATEQQAIEYLSSFNYISIRERSSAEYIKRITGRADVITSIDPVFLIEKNNWLNLMKEYKINGEYILVYMIHGTERLFQSIRDFSKIVNLKIITFPSMSYKKKPYEVDFADIEILDADPFQFVNLINNASYIFTDSFHGTAFSLILHKEAFVSKANEIAFSRIDNILSLLHAYQLVIPSEGLSPMQYLKKREVDWVLSDKIILEQRENSIQYLKKILEA